MFKHIATYLIIVCISGCGSNPAVKKPVHNMDSIYTHVNRQGKLDTVQALRQGLQMNHMNGSQDPFIPIRSAALIVPVWVPTQTHPITGERISGHWKWLEVEEESWTN